MAMISEILQTVSKTKSKKEKIRILQENGSQALKNILVLIFNESITLDLPEGEPPFDELEVDMPYQAYKEFLKFDYFYPPSPKYIKQTLKREIQFINILSRVNVEEARLLIAAKDGVNPYPGIDKETVQKAFPGLVGE